jgi:hypothetical protein
MAKLGTNDKQVLEKLFQMGSGYVLNFNDRTFGEFFHDDVGLNIYDAKYLYGSGSKANRMRGFWLGADDSLVGKSIQKLISYIENQILLENLKKEDFPAQLMNKGREIESRLLGVTTVAPESTKQIPTEDQFLTHEFGNVSLEKLGLDGALVGILSARIDEIRKCLKARAPLAAIFLCGSTLEGLLLGIACQKTKEFNQSAVSPKDKTGKVKHFSEWTLSDLINVARDLRLVGEDVKKFSHALRDFRNYIHPFEQMSSGFSPDDHTAKICWQVVQAAITQLSKYKSAQI